MLFFLLKVAGVLAIFQMVQLMTFFNSRKNRNKSNKYLSLLLLVYTMQICAIVFMSSFQHETLVKYNFFPAFCNQFALLFGPLLWLYSRTIMNLKPLKSKFLHFLPFASMMIYMVIRKIADPTYLFWFSSFRIYTSGIILTHSLIYIIITGIFFQLNKESCKSYFNQSSDLKILYSFLLAGLISIWVLKFNTFIFIDVWRRYEFCPYTTSLYFIAGFLFFNTLVYLAMIKPELFARKKKYQNSNMSLEKKKHIIKELIKYLEIEKIYSDSSVTLSILSKKTGISPHQLSQVINEEFNMNFSTLINNFRIKEAEFLLLNNGGEFTIQQIMYDVGFNSKSAFNSAFKKQCGCTPKEFKEKTCKKQKANVQNEIFL